MSLRAAIESALPELRAHAESLMADTCRITRPGEGGPVFDSATGQYVDPAPVTVYEGPCRLNTPGMSGARDAAAGEASWATQDAILSLPVEGSGHVPGELLRPGQTVEYLTSVNPRLEGRVFGVVALHDETHPTAVRLRVRETTGE